MKFKKVLVTGSAGFIGWHMTKFLLDSGEYDVIGIDILNEYYDVNLKFKRLKQHGIDINDLNDNKIIRSRIFENYRFLKADISDHDLILNLFLTEKFDYVINLAAQAGVRYSIENPRAYISSNIEGFLSILEGCKLTKVKHLLYASTSSVYGLNTTMPLSEAHSTDHPISLYSATKKSNEMFAHSYSHLFEIPSTGLRFFTVYGPWGRPDMALYLFAEAIVNNKPIKVFNHGSMIRDFTFVDDVVKSIYMLITKPPIKNVNWNSDLPTPNKSSAPFQIFNVGNSKPTLLNDYINELEVALGKKADKINFPIQPGDVPVTHSENSALENYINFTPKTSIKEGVQKFAEWYKYYNEFKF